MQAVRDHDTSFNYQQYVEWRLRALAAKNYEEKKLRKLKKWLSDVNLIADQIKNRNGQIKIDPSNETCLLLALYCACRHLIRSTHSLGGTIDSEDQDVIDLVSNYFNSNPDLILSCAPK